MRRLAGSAGLAALVVVGVLAGLVVVAVPGVAGAGVWASVSGPSVPVGSVFSPVVPSRVLDSRPGLANEGFVGPVGPGGSKVLQVAGSGPVPVGAVAVVMNVTVTGGSAGSFLTVYPADAVRPTAANLNFGAGQTVPNLVVVKLSAGGAVRFFNELGSVHVVADVVGFFGESGDTYRSVDPLRVLDSRTEVGGWGEQLHAGEARVLPVAGVGGVAGVPAGASAAVMNVTVTGGSAASYLTVFPGDATTPTAANLLFAPGQTVPNLVVSKLGEDGSVKVFNQLGDVDVIVDVVGFFESSPHGARFVATVPSRILDDRAGTGGYSTPWGPGQARTVDVAGTDVVGDGAVAVVMNTTATQGTAGTYLTVYPSAPEPPTAANLLVAPGETIPNLVVSGLSKTGTVDVFNQQGQVSVIGDVAGYFVAPHIGEIHVEADGALKSVTFEPDGTYTIVYDGVPDPAPVADDVINVGVTTATPNGLLAKVVSSAIDPGGDLVVVGIPIGLFDAVPEGSFSFDEAGLPGGAPVGGTGGAGPVTEGGLVDFLQFKSGKHSVTCSGGSSVTVENNTDRTIDHARFVLDWGEHWYSIDKLEAVVSWTKTDTTELITQGTGSCTYSGKLGNGWTGPLVECPFGPVLVPCQASFVPEVSLGGSFDGTTTAAHEESSSQTVGFSYDADRIGDSLQNLTASTDPTTTDTVLPDQHGTLAAGIDGVLTIKFAFGLGQVDFNGGGRITGEWDRWGIGHPDPPAEPCWRIAAAFRAGARARLNLIPTDIPAEYGVELPAWLKKVNVGVTIGSRDSLWTSPEVELARNDTTDGALCAPHNPTNLHDTATEGTTAELAWDPPDPAKHPDIDHYTITRDGTPLADTPATTYDDTTPQPGSRHLYTITAVDTSDLEGRYPADPLEVIAAPDGLTAQRRTGAVGVVDLDWNGIVPTPTRPEFMHYEIERNGTVIATTTNPAYTDTTAPDPFPAAYRITAIYADGARSKPSEERTATAGGELWYGTLDIDGFGNGLSAHLFLDVDATGNGTWSIDIDNTWSISPSCTNEHVYSVFGSGTITPSEPAGFAVTFSELDGTYQVESRPGASASVLVHEETRDSETCALIDSSSSFQPAGGQFDGIWWYFIPQYASSASITISDSATVDVVGVPLHGAWTLHRP